MQGRVMKKILNAEISLIIFFINRKLWKVFISGTFTLYIQNNIIFLCMYKKIYSMHLYFILQSNL